jgi:aspartyl/asparaginyl-tRNA synthetase
MRYLSILLLFGPILKEFEISQTTRHLAEFNMIEPELAFADLTV